ncbi:GNAT family N-acetyltransferase [Nonomuraea sp. MG754425]|uniref:GNAT family N-acetyltransferase n=1 Tax=Nonomuraea sp. MG754425 TaxID=2570319 RepID=UPI001F3A9D31|nr:GNAT family N-acetyltransferase [Nonomuraea sp. MG754425]MCF6473326.1 GNAT family N-acetyltransferase [Nonomuraea sp. MG754425]
MRFDFLQPDRDPEPPGWESFRRDRDLTAVWSYEVIRASFDGSWARPLLCVAREGERVAGFLGALLLGRGPLLLDVRLPAHSNGPTWCLPDGAEGRAIIRGFERAAAAEFGRRLAGVVYRMVTEPALPLVARRGAVVRRSPGTTRLPVRWTTSDEWIATLSRNRRSTLRRQLKRIAQDRTLRVAEGSARTDLDPAELAELHERHAARVTSRTGPGNPPAGLLTRLLARPAAAFDRRLTLPAAYFAELIRRDDVRTLSYHQDERLLAFAIVYDHPVTPMYGPWAALPADEGGRKDLYFDSYARIIAHAAAGRAGLLFAGRGFVDVKTSLGFEYLPMSLVAVPRWAIG